MRCVVIGVGGVGMAHVCAIARSGHLVLSIVDSDPDILLRSSKKWENKWMAYEEKVPVQDGVIYCRTINEIQKLSLLEDDLIIISTPPETHASLMIQCLSLFKCRILVEKPISSRIIDISNARLHISSEWIYHSELTDIDNISSMRMSFPPNDHKWELNLALDFCPHLFSILLHKGHDIFRLDKEHIMDDAFFMRADSNKGYINLSGDRNPPYGLFIDDRQFNWEEDLFDKQLSMIGEIDIWDQMLELENSLKSL